jgi:hypothetical protein
VTCRSFARGLVVALVVCVFGVAAGRASADDPVYVGWVSLLPTLAEPEDPTSINPCRKGDLRCVRTIAREMTRRFDRLAPACSHSSVFALTYLRVTEEYARTLDADPGFFNDPAFVNNEVGVFASYYFSAFDAWAAGKRERVPKAWQIAFAAAEQRRVGGTGNLLLEINAHVSRDLPFVLERMGLFGEDAASRKPDHDKVNVILNRVEGEVMAEISRRFDPSVSDPSKFPTTLDETTLYQVLQTWREEAWRNAERLARAATESEKQLVAQSIEDASAVKAVAIVAGTSYLPPVTSTTTRDAYCAQHWSDA